MQKGMDNLMHGRTVFVIAHRLSTIQNSDVIMVMDHGRIIERGNHEQLIEKKAVTTSFIREPLNSNDMGCATTVITATAAWWPAGSVEEVPF